MQKVETRHRALGHVGFVDDTVQGARSATFELHGNFRKSLFRLAHHHVIGRQKCALRVCAGPRTSYKSAPPKGASAGQDGQRIRTLRMHRADHHQIAQRKSSSRNSSKA